MSIYGGWGFDAYDEPVKGITRGSGSPNDYTGGGGSGGGGGGTGGSSFASLGNVSGGQVQQVGTEGVPVILRKRGLPHIPGVTPGKPAKQDTVPAMLTPGEIVMNPGVTKNPQIAAALLALNQQGAHNMMNGRGPIGMEYGGEVPGYFAGGIVAKLAPKLLGLLGKGGAKAAAPAAGGAAAPAAPAAPAPAAPAAPGASAPQMPQRPQMPGGTAQQQAGLPQIPGSQPISFTPPQMQGYMPPPPPMYGGGGFAYGGMAGEDGGDSHEAGYPSSAVRILQLLLELDEAEQGEYGDGEDGAEGHAFGGVAGQFAGAMARRAMKRLKYQFKPGRMIAGSVPGFAFGGLINTGGKPKIDPYGYERQMSGDINAARGAGYFDPRGNQALIRGQLEGAQGTADALVRRQMTQASLGGMDPAQQAVAKQQALMQTGRGVQDIMAQTRGNALQSQDTYFKQQAQNAANTAMTARTQNDLQRAQEYRQGGLGNFVGGLAGKAIGNYIGPQG